MVMSRRSREAVTLARHLWIYWGLAAGAVEVRWTDGWFKGGVYRQGWEIAWDDGPIGELVRADRVRYQRCLTLTAWAVNLVHHARDGATVPELAEPRTEQAWRESLECVEFPERARTPEEQAL